MSPPSVLKKKKKKEEEGDGGGGGGGGGGELLFCGATCWDAIGRSKVSSEGNLVSPTRIRSLVGIDIRYVASGCASCHCVALDVDGRCYTWGRNEKGQLGHGDKTIRNSPTVVSALSGYKVVKAASGGGHTVVLTEDGISLSFGWNKHGQLGTGSTKKEFELSPVHCLVSSVKDVACGTDFTVWLTSVEGATILTAGCPQYGQLGHGTDHEYNTKQSSVKLAYEAQPLPKAIASLSDETIVKVVCGTNHTVALDSKGYVYTWGFGGYGRLGHREQRDEWSPRRVEIFTKHNILPPGAVISAGSVTSACSKGAGHMYMWGKIKQAGDNWMYPKPLMDLSGWNVRCMDSGNMHHFVGADSSCISWGTALSGELGYGPNQQKSSAIPKTVDVLEGMHVISVACGLTHSLVVVDRSNVGDQLDQLAVFDGKDPEGDEEPGIKPKSAKKTSAKNAAKTPETSNKRMKISKEYSGDEEPGIKPKSAKKTSAKSAAKTPETSNKRMKVSKEYSGDEEPGIKPKSAKKTSAKNAPKMPETSNKRMKISKESSESKVEKESNGEMKVSSGRKNASSGQTSAKTPETSNKRMKISKESSELKVEKESNGEMKVSSGRKKVSRGQTSARGNAAKTPKTSNKRIKISEESSELKVEKESNGEMKVSSGRKKASSGQTSARGNAAKTPETSNKRMKISIESSESKVEKESNGEMKVSSGRKKASSGQTSARGNAAKTPETSNKRMKISKESSESKVGKESNGEMKVSSGRKKASSGQTSARGRPSVAKKAGRPAKRKR